MPRQLLGYRCFTRYDEAHADPHREHRLLETVKAQSELAQDEILMWQNLGKSTTVDASLSVLYDQRLSLAPLFRYCLARSMAAQFAEDAPRFSKIAARWETEAARTNQAPGRVREEQPPGRTTRGLLRWGGRHLP